MFSQVTLDPTAGERARLVRELPDVPLPILDPTAGEHARLIRELPEVPVAILDPTDPRCGSYPGSLRARRRA